VGSTGNSLFQGNDLLVNPSLHSGRCLPQFGILPWKSSFGVRYLKPTYEKNETACFPGHPVP